MVPEELLDRVCVERVDAADFLELVEAPIRGHNGLDAVGHAGADMESVVRSQAWRLKRKRQPEGLVRHR